MPDNRELADAQRVGEQEYIADQFVGRIGVDLLRLGRTAIAALIGCDAAESVREIRDLAAPCAVAFRKAVEEDQRRRIEPLNSPWPLLNHRTEQRRVGKE